MRQNVAKPIDSFGKELENPVEAGAGEEPKWSDLIWGPHQSDQNVHYLHGALHLFDSGAEIVKEQYNSAIAGNSDDKLAHIKHNRYLSH